MKKETLRITEAKFATQRGRKIPEFNLRECNVVKVSGIVKKDTKKIYVNVEVIKEEGDFYLQYSDLVRIESAHYCSLNKIIKTEKK